MTLEYVFEREFEMGTIRCPDDVKPLLEKYAQSPQEMFLAITLNGAREPIKCHVTSLGTVNCSPVVPRDIFREAVADNACAIIVAHNHPSGSTTPSDQDIESTRQLIKAGELMGIQVIDHIIFTPQGNIYDFLEHGMMTTKKRKIIG